MPAATEALGLLQPPPSTYFSEFKAHRPGGRLPKKYRPQEDEDLDT